MKSLTDEEKWVNYIKEYSFSGNVEADHSEADKALILFLNSLGYTKIVKEWEKVKKWYA